MYAIQDFLNTPFGGILGIAHMVLALYALYLIFTSNMDAVNKVLWAIAVIVFPIIGLLMFYLVGRKPA